MTTAIPYLPSFLGLLGDLVVYLFLTGSHEIDFTMNLFFFLF